MTPPIKPPFLVLQFIRRLIPGPLGREVIEDLTEQMILRSRTSPWKARLWCWRQMLSLDWIRLRRELGCVGWSAAADGPDGWTVGALSRGLGTSVAHGLRDGLRGMRRQPGVILTVVLTLALGIGATTAMFSVVHAVLLKPLPYPDAQQLVFLWASGQSNAQDDFSGPQAAELVEQTNAFEDVAQVKGRVNSILQTDASVERVVLETVSPNYFEIYRIPPLLGRTFRPEDEHFLPVHVIRDPSAPRPIGAVVLSHGFWARSFGSNPRVIGSTVLLGGHPEEIVGVMPAGFLGHLPTVMGRLQVPDLWVLSHWDPTLFPRDVHFVSLLARLKAGVTLDRARSEMDLFAERQRRENPELAEDQFRLLVRPLHGEVSGPAAQRLTLLSAAVLLVLLIACANVATILLIRASYRARESALCSALGAARLRLVVQALSETTTYCAVGCLLGYGVALLALNTLVELVPPNVPRLQEIELDRSVLLFSLATTIGVALLSGIVPALCRGWTAPADVLRSAIRGGSRSLQSRLGSSLAVCETALAVVLVVGTGLLLRSFVLLLDVDPGFPSRSLLVGGISMSSSNFPSNQVRVRFYQELRRELESHSEVVAAGIGHPLPFDQAFTADVVVGDDSQNNSFTVDYRRVAPGFLEALGVPLLEGRTLRSGDLSDPDRLYAVIDRTFAESAFPGTSAVGKSFFVHRLEYAGADQVTNQARRVEIVGVSGPIRGHSLRTEDRPTAYISYTINLSGDTAFLVRFQQPAEGALSMVKDSLLRITPQLPIYDAAWMEDRLLDSIASIRFSLSLLAGFGLLGLLLAGVGVFGVLAYSVSSRTMEIGLRSALGATRGSIARLIMKQGLALGGVGILIGLAASKQLYRVLAGQLYGIETADPWTFLGVSLIFLIVAALACWVPTRRALAISPNRALSD